MKILVGSMYCFENEYEDSILSLYQQTYRKFDHFKVEKLPNKLAHDTLYSTFMENSKFYDLFLKLDADMVICKNSFLQDIVNFLKNKKILTNLQIKVHDFFTDRLIWGLHIFNNKNKWVKNNELVFTDMVSLHNERINISSLDSPLVPAAWHSPNPSLIQAFHFGIHKAVKATQFRNSIKQSWREAHANNILLLYKRWLNSFDKKIGYAVLGSFEGILSKLNHSHLDFDNCEFLNLFKKYENFSMDELENTINRLKTETISKNNIFDYENLKNIHSYSTDSNKLKTGKAIHILENSSKSLQTKLLNTVSLYLKNGLFDKAQDTILTYYEIYPQKNHLDNLYSQIMLKHANSYLKNGLLNDALAYLLVADLFSPNNPTLLMELANLFRDLEMDGMAAYYFSKANYGQSHYGKNEDAAIFLQPKENNDQLFMNHEYKSICLALSEFNPKTRKLNGPGFSTKDTLNSLLTFLSGNITILTSFSPQLPEAIIEYTSEIKDYNLDAYTYPSWSLAARWNMDEQVKPDLMVIDGGRKTTNLLNQHKIYPNCPKVYIHRGSPHQLMGTYTGNDFFQAEFQEMQACAYQVSVSENVMQEWMKYPELADKTWFYIPNCAREEEAEKILLKDRDKLRSKLGFPEKSFVAVSVASLQRRKGQDILISLMPEISYKIKNFQLLLVGPTLPSKGGDEIVRLAESSKFASRIHILGPRIDALELIYASDCMILPSREEALPRAVLEAMTLKTPVIASDVNGIPELIEHESHGLLFSHDRPRALAKYIHTIAKNQDFGKNLAEKAYNRYWQKFSRYHHSQRWQSALSMMLLKDTKENFKN